MNFPTRKSDILSLADRMISGLSENPQSFPDPPFSADTFVKLLKEIQNARQNRQSAKASLTLAVRDQREKIAELEKLLRRINRSHGGYQPSLPEHFRQLTAIVHAHPKTVPIMYLRRFGVLL
jgi:hypothetical protein